MKKSLLDAVIGPFQGSHWLPRRVTPVYVPTKVLTLTGGLFGKLGTERAWDFRTGVGREKCGLMTVGVLL